MGSGAIQFNGRTANFNYAVAQLHPPPPSVFFDFLQDAISDADHFTITQSGSPTAAAVSASAGDPVAGHGGWLAGATDDVDAEADEVAFSTSGTAGFFRADQVGLGIIAVEWAISVPTALTTRNYFAGVSDDATEGSGAIAIQVNSGTTVTDTATDAAGWLFNSGGTDATNWNGASTDTNSQSTLTQGPAAAADTWIGLRTEIDVNGDCYFSTRSKRGGSVVVYGKSSTGTSPDVLLLPYFAASPTTTVAVPWEIDYMFAVAQHAV